jgi:succinyl-CoA synthetase beta subunit
MADPGRLLLRRLGVPTFERIGLAARFLSELTGPAPAPGAAVALNPGLLEPEATFRLLASAGILAPARVVLSLEELERLRSPLEGLSGPWVVKLDATGIAHKANLGGVLLRQEPGEAVVDGVRRAAERMRALGAPPAMLVVEELVSAEVELLVSVLNDETFGLVCALGLGGVRADRLAKPALSLGVPTGAEVVRLLESSGAIDDLMRADLDRDAVADELSAVYGALSQLVNHPAPSDPALRLIELNPVAVTRDPRRRIVALDATVVTARAQSASGQREVGA